VCGGQMCCPFLRRLGQPHIIINLQETSDEGPLRVSSIREFKIFAMLGIKYIDTEGL
jgi:hypothetical protein